MKISVVISTYTVDRLNHVIKCVESIKNQSLKPNEILLVVDPIDEVVETYKKTIKNVKVVVSDGLGLSKARNKGVLESKGDIIAFIDDDAWADRYWLERIIKNYLDDEEVYCVGGKIIPVFENSRPKWLPEELDWIVGCTYKGMPEVKSEIRNPIGANMSFRREAFEIAGLFREEVGRYGKRLLSGEEAEFAMRLKKLNPDAKIVYDPSAIVYHHVPASRCKFGYAIKRAYYEGFSKAILSKAYNLREEKKYLGNILYSATRKILKLKIQEVVGMVTISAVVLIGYIHGKMVDL